MTTKEHDWIIIPLGDGKDCRKCGATEKNENDPCILTKLCNHELEENEGSLFCDKCKMP